MKRIVSLIAVLSIFISSYSLAFADQRDTAISHLKNEYVKLMGGDKAEDRATKEIDELIAAMEGDQYDAQVAMDNIEVQVHALALNSDRKDDADDAIEDAEEAVDDFVDMDAKKYIEIIPSQAGGLPYGTATSGFRTKQATASEAIMEVRKILINPDRPGSVPTGDLISDFIPMIIRQLFRFAWLAVFISLTVSGIMFVIAHDDEDRLTKAKSMLHFTLIGFAFVAMAFAIVKAISDIDFFAFV